MTLRKMKCPGTQPLFSALYLLTPSYYLTLFGLDFFFSYFLLKAWSFALDYEERGVREAVVEA